MELQEVLFRSRSGWSAPLPNYLDSDRTVVLAFADSSFQGHPAAFEDLRAAFPLARVLGCSTAGAIRHDRVLDEGVVAVVARFETIALRTVTVPTGPGAESFAAGAELSRRLAGPDLRAMVVLSDGLDVNGSELVRGVNSVTPPHVMVTGGLAADGERFQRTWVVSDWKPAPRSVVALGLYGERLVSTHGSRGGWDIFGVERRVTRAKGNVLYEGDGKPALKLYKEYLGDRADGLPSTALLFPLSMRTDDAAEKQLVRTVLAVDERAQSLTFAGDIPDGSRVQLMHANLDRLIQGASDAAKSARSRLDVEGPSLSLAISCVGRRLVLGERTEEELEATLESLPAGTRQVGFYSYGELSPFASGSCDLHNQTMTLSVFAERT